MLNDGAGASGACSVRTRASSFSRSRPAGENGRCRPCQGRHHRRQFREHGGAVRTPRGEVGLKLSPFLPIQRPHGVQGSPLGKWFVSHETAQPCVTHMFWNCLRPRRPLQGAHCASERGVTLARLTHTQRHCKLYVRSPPNCSYHCTHARRRYPSVRRVSHSA